MTKPVWWSITYGELNPNHQELAPNLRITLIAFVRVLRRLRGLPTAVSVS